MSVKYVLQNGSFCGVQIFLKYSFWGLKNWLNGCCSYRGPSSQHPCWETHAFCSRRSSTLLWYLQGTCTHVVCISSHRNTHTHTQSIPLVDGCLEIQDLWSFMFCSCLCPRIQTVGGLGQLGDKAYWLLAQGRSCMGRWRMASITTWMLPCSLCGPLMMLD